jgi:single-strand DNA-binding protein
MLNRVILMGRITQDLEVRQTPAGVSALTFNIAVDRNFKNQSGEYDADFITCVAWRNTAEFIGRYFGKGRMIALEGQLRSRTYEDKNGTKHYVTEVYVDTASFTGEKTSQDAQRAPQNGFNVGSGSTFNQAQPFVAGTQQPPQMRDAGHSLSIGDLSEFEEVLNDEGVPF